MKGGEQMLLLNSRCFDQGLIVPVHELMHTLGFVHEHTRTLVLAGFCFGHFSNIVLRNGPFSRPFCNKKEKIGNSLV